MVPRTIHPATVDSVDPTALDELRALAQRADAGDPFAALVFTEPLDLDTFEQWLGRVGRVDRPALLFDAWYSEKIDRSTLTAVIGNVWSDAEYPNQNLDTESWRDLFGQAGYTVDGKAVDRPAEPIRLWRGSVPERQADWSWSADRTVAERFAAGIRGRKPGRLYTVTAPPEALLCANNGRDEAEYVVDTHGLDIREVTR